MGRGRRHTAILALAIILLAGYLPYNALSQSEMPALSWNKLANNTILVETEFYSLILDGDKGGITRLAVKDGGSQVDMLRDGDLIPIPLIDITTGPGGGEYTRSLGNLTYTLDYPSSLSLGNWSVEVVYNDSLKLVVELKPGDSALEDIKPATAVARITFHSWTPIIEYTLTITNPTSDTLMLSGRNGSAVIGVRINDGDTTWRYAVRTGGNISIVDSVDAPAQDVSKVFLFRSLDGRIRYIAYIGVEPGAEAVKGFRGISTGNYTSNETFNLLLDYGDPELGPGESINISLTFTYIKANPFLLSEIGILEDVIEIDEKVLADIKTAAAYQDIINDLNETVNSLRERVKNLQQTLEEKNKKLEECKGCEDYWKTELNVLKNRVDQLEANARNAGLRQVIAFIAGLILGFIGVRYAFR